MGLKAKDQVEVKLSQVFFEAALGLCKDGVSVLWDFAGKRILSGYCGNGQKNAEPGNDCYKLVFLEMCSIRAACLPHPLLLMCPCNHTLTLCFTGPDCFYSLGRLICHRTPQLQLLPILQ